MEIMSFRLDGTSTVCRVTSCVTFAYAEFMHDTGIIPRCISKEKISVGVYIYIGCVDPRDPIPWHGLTCVRREGKQVSPVRDAATKFWIG